MTKARDIADFKFENITDTGTEGTKVATGTTAQRGSTTGQWRYNTDVGYFEGRNTDGTFSSLEPAPVINTVTPSTFNGEAGTSIVIAGNNFGIGATVKLIGNDGTQYNAQSVTRNNVNQITFTTPNLLVNNEPYDVKVINSGGSSGTLEDALDAGGSPSWSSYAGDPHLLGGVLNTATGTHFTLNAVDPEGQAVTYSTSGSVWSGQNLTLNSDGTITGDPTDQVSNTTYNETVTATDDAGNTSQKTLGIKIGTYDAISAGDGSDGSLTVSALSQPNDYYAIIDANKASGSNTFTLDTVANLAIGDKVLIWQVQDSTAPTNAGKMLYTNITNISGSIATTADNITWNMVSNDYDNTTAHNAQMIRIPQYTSVTVSSGGVLAPSRWTGTKGGILVLEATGNITVDSGGYLVGDGMGFRGGTGGLGGNTGSPGASGYAGYIGEGRTGNGLNFSSSTTSVTGHTALHSVGGSFNTAGYGAGGSSGDGLGGGGGAGGGQHTDISSNLFLMGGGAGGGGGGSAGNHSDYGRGGAGGGSGGGLIMIRCNNFTNNGIIRSRPAYGAGAGSAEDYGGSAFAASGTGSAVGVVIGSHTLGNGHGNWNTYDVASAEGTKGTNGGSGTGQGGAYGLGSSGGDDHGGEGGYTAVVGGGNGGKGDNGNDGGGGGGAGGSGGGGASSGHDIGGAGGGGQGGSGGVIWIEATNVNVGSNMTTPRGIGGGGGGSTSGSESAGRTGGDAQYDITSATGYRNGASALETGASSYYATTAAGAAGFAGDLGKIHISTGSGTYSGTVASTDNGQSQTGGTVTTATNSGSSPFGNNGYVIS